MSNTLIFARAQPKSIKLTEKYKYRVQVSANQQASQAGQPSGKIEITVPYDGKKHVTTQTIDDIKGQDWRAWVHPTTNARIGFLSFANHEQTDLKATLPWNLYNVLPIEIPVKNHVLHTSNILLANSYVCRITHEYQPQWPDGSPLAVDVNLNDEEIQKELQIDLSKNISGNDIQLTLSPIEIYKIAQLLIQQNSFERGLIISFALVLALPYALGQEKKEEKNTEQKKTSANPQIERIAIEWPASIAHDLVLLTIDGKEQPVIYEPEQGVIAWQGVHFNVPDQKTEGTDLYHYYAPLMLLSIEQPGDLYGRQTLKGEIKIKIPCALSGVGMSYFSANGAPNDTTIEHWTEIAVDLELLLADCFERRLISPYQQLQFEGVITEDMRVRDLEYLLRDLGFVVGSAAVNNGDLPTSLTVALKQRELEELRVWILIEGKPSRTMRDRAIPGDQVFRTELDAGHTVLYMRGILKGNSTSLIESMNTLQHKLRERFFHVSTTK